MNGHCQPRSGRRVPSQQPHEFDESVIPSVARKTWPYFQERVIRTRDSLTARASAESERQSERERGREGATATATTTTRTGQQQVQRQPQRSSSSSSAQTLSVTVNAAPRRPLGSSGLTPGPCGALRNASPAAPTPARREAPANMPEDRRWPLASRTYGLASS